MSLCALPDATSSRSLNPTWHRQSRLPNRHADRLAPPQLCEEPNPVLELLDDMSSFDVSVFEEEQEGCEPWV